MKKKKQKHVGSLERWWPRKKRRRALRLSHQKKRKHQSEESKEGFEKFEEDSSELSEGKRGENNLVKTVGSSVRNKEIVKLRDGVKKDDVGKSNMKNKKGEEDVKKDKIDGRKKGKNDWRRRGRKIENGDTVQNRSGDLKRDGVRGLDGLAGKGVVKGKGKRGSDSNEEIDKKNLKKVFGKGDSEYFLEVDGAKVRIKIERKGRTFFYNLFMEDIDVGTNALLMDIRKDLISITSVGAGEIMNQKSIYKIKEKFMADTKKLLNEKVPGIDPKTVDFLVGVLMQDMLGLGKIEFLISDSNLEEIVIVSSSEPVRVYHKGYGWLPTNIYIKSEDEISNYANIIARRVGREISVLNPLLDAHILTGDRSNAVFYPIATKGNTITIRKFARDPLTIIDLIANKTIGEDMAAILWLAVEYEMNVLISGGTASGKTSFLNACMPFIPPNHRIISIEDTRELMLPEFLYWTPLVTRTPNVENKGEVSMLDLLVNSLRMRPDRIVLGEIRRQKEAEVLFEAMHTGHSVYATVHADTASETIRRLINPPINVPPSMLGSVHLNVVMFRDRKKGFRRVFQLAEFIPEKDRVFANILQRWIPETDEFVSHNQSMSFFDILSRNTGMSQHKLLESIEQRKVLFRWLLKHKIRDLNSIGKFMHLFYTNREELNSIVVEDKVEKILVSEKMKEGLVGSNRGKGSGNGLGEGTNKERDLNEKKKKEDGFGKNSSEEDNFEKKGLSKKEKKIRTWKKKREEKRRVKKKEKKRKVGKRKKREENKGERKIGEREKLEEKKEEMKREKKENKKKERNLRKANKKRERNFNKVRQIKKREEKKMKKELEKEKKIR